MPTVLTLMTSMKTVVSMHPSWADSANAQQTLAAEQATVTGAAHLHAISSGILTKVQQDYLARGQGSGARGGQGNTKHILVFP